MKERRPILGTNVLIVACVLSLAVACSPDTRFPERTDCDIQRGPCVRVAGSATEITFDVTPRPVKAMADLLFTVMVRRNGKPASGADVALDLSMPGMHMGVNSPKLSPDKDGRYAGRGVIVRCPSGKRVWKAQVTVHSKQGTETASFLLEVI